MATASQEFTVERAATGSATEEKLLDYRDLSIFDKFLFDLRVAAAYYPFKVIFRVLRLLQGSHGPSGIYEKSYKRHPQLKHRIIPSANTDVPPPLFLDIHGGGFILGENAIDDEVNHHLASALNNNCLIISLDYTKAPRVQFPTPTNELIDTVVDILDDSSLIFDRSRVVIGGYSAGGNLCLSVAQSPLLKDKIQGVVSWYPAVDFTVPLHDKVMSRPYPNSKERDGLEKSYNLFKRAYMPHDLLQDPRASVTFAKRDTLPKHLFIIGAELDLLCKEAAVMAGKYAGVDVESLWNKDVDEKYGFEAEGIKWKCVRNAKHGFNFSILTFGEERKRRAEAARQHYLEIARWLVEGPFSSQKP